MTVLYILLGLIVLIISAAFLNINLMIEYKEELSIKIRILFFKFDIKKRFEKDADKTGEKVLKDTKAEAGEGRKNRTAGEIIGFIKYLTRIIKDILKTFFKYARLKICYMDVRVASDDAAKTARLYGLVCQAVYYLIEFLNHFTTLKKNDKKINVYSDFLKEECGIKFKIVLTLKPWQMAATWMKIMPILQNRKGKKDERNAIKTGH